MRTNSIPRKTAWVINEPTSFTTGSMLKGKTTFLTRCALLIITPVEPLIISEKVFQIAIAAVIQTTKGTLPFGADLNPILNTSHMMKIMISGLIKVQKKPSNEPTCWVDMSRLAISMIRNLR